MKVAHILVCHSYVPTALFGSLQQVEGATWYIFLHGDNQIVAKTVEDFVVGKNARIKKCSASTSLSSSWNDGIEGALIDGADVFLLLNDDLHFYDNQYTEFLRVTEIVSKSPDISYVTTLGFEPLVDGRTVPQHFACCALTRRCVEATGCFDENFFPAYNEDVDYFIRSSRLGFHPHVEQRSLVEHRRGGTTALFSTKKRAEFEIQKEACGQYFLDKWSISPYYTHPFNDCGVSFSIPFAARAAPYGHYDRTDRKVDNAEG